MKKSKKKLKKPLPSIVRVVGIIVVLICCFNSLNGNKTRKLSKNAQKKVKIVQSSVKSDKKNTKKVQKIEIAEAVYVEPEEETPQYNVETNQKIEENNNEMKNIVESSYTTRMTSYYPEEGETTTATGLGIYDFNVNDNGWFTYNGKLVVATASNRLGYTEMKTYNLYDEIILNIDGVDYDAVVLDVCGACQRDNRIDLFVSGSWAVKDTMIEVKE